MPARNESIRIRRFGDPSVLELAPTDIPALRAGEVLVRLRHIGVNYVDLYQREGRYPGVTLPLVPGIEGAGEVLAAAPGSDFAVGDAVAFTTGVQGAYSRVVAVPEAHLLRIPPALGTREAAAALEQGLTAAMLIDDVARLAPGDPVLVHAAAGGVGGWLVQWLVARGHMVYGTTSTVAKADWLRKVGAIPLDAKADWSAAVRDVAVVFDSVGRDTLDGSFAALRVGGHLVIFGAASGPPPALEVSRLMARSLTVTRPVLPQLLADPAKRRARADRVFAAVASGEVQLRIHAELDLAEAATAHTWLASRQTAGKLLLRA